MRTRRLETASQQQQLQQVVRACVRACLVVLDGGATLCCTRTAALHRTRLCSARHNVAWCTEAGLTRPNLAPPPRRRLLSSSYFSCSLKHVDIYVVCVVHKYLCSYLATYILIVTHSGPCLAHDYDVRKNELLQKSTLFPLYTYYILT